MDKKWKKLLENPSENWRDEWNQRSKLTRFDTSGQAEKWMEKHQEEYDAPLMCDLHVKDGFVVYIQK